MSSRDSRTTNSYVGQCRGRITSCHGASDAAFAVGGCAGWPCLGSVSSGPEPRQGGLLSAVLLYLATSSCTAEVEAKDIASSIHLELLGPKPSTRGVIPKPHVSGRG